MRTIVLWAVALACLCLMFVLAMLPVRAEAFDIDAYIDNANVLVGDENRDFCSGTVISIKDRLVLTAEHCVSDRVTREEREIVDPNTGEVTKKTFEKNLDLVVSKNVTKGYEKIARQSFVAKIYRRDAENDVAILQVTDPSWLPLGEAKLAPDGYKVKRGETVYVVGNPGVELDNSITKGIVSATERTLDFGNGKKLHVFQTDAPAIGGNSGGSVLNEAGELVGTLSAGMRGTTITFVVPISATQKLLKAGQSTTGTSSKPYQYGPMKADRMVIEHLDMKGDGGTVFNPLLWLLRFF